MFKFSFVLLSLIAATASGAPLEKRIAQTISASTAKWEQACLAAGGGQQCNPQSVASFTTLLAAAGPCDQQDQADKMIDLAKTLQNNGQVIALTQIFAQQPRNTPTSLSVPYCQKAPRNAELDGLFQCQFAGANPKVFVGGVAVGGQGTIPFGHNAPLSPPGSCPANPNGPVPDGQQLVDITQNPGTGSQTGPNMTTPTPAPSPPAPSPSPSPSSNTDSTSGDFHLQNGKDAQKLNAEFATLTANSPCTDGENACVGSSFAQCVGGKFVTTPCAGGLMCAALPLVNKPGTSITCTTQADANARIAATGATGGLTGS
ncbi:proline-rich protein [Amanita muscaria]